MEKSELSELRDLVRVQGAQIATMQRLLEAQGPVMTPLQSEKAREDWLKTKTEELSKTAERRTQEEADRLWAKECSQKYPVQIGWVPMVNIPARSPEEATERYRKLCGIRSGTEVEPVVGKPV